ncbi:hypothetical protein [Leisingera thetidis]|uniref:hypothetical protein n=1 Tax=Leisingera thetidis TaxID=2930199 RepID=UPI0021F6D0C9|nr:hypothetical protein [Leisingera thetidis]
MSQGETRKSRYVLKTYADLPPRQPAPSRRFADYLSRWQKLRESHPKHKLFAELVGWLLMVAFAYYGADTFSNYYKWGAVLLFALFGWVFPVFRAIQWLRIRNAAK